MPEPTNRERAERALAALRAWKLVANEAGEPDASEDVVDLIADLHHYVQRENGTSAAVTIDDFDRLTYFASERFATETALENNL